MHFDPPPHPAERSRTVGEHPIARCDTKPRVIRAPKKQNCPFVIMITFIGNRPALQIGRYQVIDYDTIWLDEALRRAARAAGCEDFPFVDEIRGGIVKYLETRCSLKLLHPAVGILSQS